MTSYNEVSDVGSAPPATLTPVEEAAIRRICPLSCVVNLAHGNTGVKGDVSCFRQDSKLATVLPNLPFQCKATVIARRDKTKSPMTSTKFSRKKIEDALVFLKATNHEAWADIEISEANLNAWPLEGDLSDFLAD